MSEQTGWICPKCGRVYAPWVKECEACNPVKVAPTPEPWTQPYPRYPYPWTTPYPYPEVPPTITYFTYSPLTYSSLTGGNIQ